jgi:hypothetical protein
MDLTKRLEKTEMEVVRLRGMLQTKNRKLIHDWLNQSNQIPKISFEKWKNLITVQSEHVELLLNGSIMSALSDTVISCVDAYINERCNNEILPIRCFLQKPNTFYIYSEEDSKWKIMANATEILTLWMGLIERKIRRKYKQEKELYEIDDDDLDQTQIIMEKINGTRLSQEKRLDRLKKWLIVKIEEDIQVTEYC